MRKRLWLHKIALNVGGKTLWSSTPEAFTSPLPPFWMRRVASTVNVLLLMMLTPDHLSRKTAPQSSEIPFAAQNV